LKVLAFDIGSSAIGYTYINIDTGEIYHLGVRRFNRPYKKFNTSKEKSLTSIRSTYRSSRKTNKRKIKRQKNVLRILQKYKFLEGFEKNTSKSYTRDHIIKKIDKILKNKYIKNNPNISKETEHNLESSLLYNLRAKALDEKIELYEFARIIYHLMQRRGFKSNRKDFSKIDYEDAVGVVKKGISYLEKKMNNTNSRTIGEYLSKINITEESIRNRYLSRDMIIYEFNMVWEKQSKFYPNIFTKKLYKKLYNEIFYQNPIKSPEPGECEFEKNIKRSSKSTLIFQEFRIVQQIYNLKLEEYNNTRNLNYEEKKLLKNRLYNEGDLAFEEIKELLKISHESKFNYEYEGNEKLLGNRIYKKLKDIFGDDFNSFSKEYIDSIVEDINSFEKIEPLYKKAINIWELSEEKANKICKIIFENGYSNLSKKAMKKLLKEMEVNDITYSEAVKNVYPRHDKIKKMEFLPNIESVPFEIYNPLVKKALAEMGKITNELIKKYGKPDKIVIELARDLKKNNKQRKEISIKNKKNEKRRKDAKDYLEKNGIYNPSNKDITKYLLWVECDKVCPYTGKNIGFNLLFNEYPQFDIEHIIPQSKTLIDGEINKTLCYHEENRSVKGNKTPYETYGGTDKWDVIKNRVRKCFSKEKYNLFVKKDLDNIDEYLTRSLNDTKYASKMAVKYLSLLYGGVCDENNKQKVFTTNGMITSKLRNSWKLNTILNNENKKSRDDHRHHAIDAIIIAYTLKIKNLNMNNYRKFNIPYDNFYSYIETKINNIKTSHEVDKRIGKKLHEDNFYSYSEESNKVYLRKSIDNLSSTMIKNNAIVDGYINNKIKKIVENKDPNDKLETVFKKDPPINKNGNNIKKVNTHIGGGVFPIGKGCRKKYVKTNTTHHLEIRECVEKGKKKWKGKLIDQFEATRRKNLKEKIINDTDNDDGKFIMSLTRNEVVSFTVDDIIKYYIISSLEENNIEFKEINDARDKLPRKGRTCSLNKLKNYCFKKHKTNILGEIVY